MSDNSFPYLDNVNVYQVQNTFDYSQWTEDTKLTVLCVPWDRDYKNVVEFSDESERDKYVKDNAILSTPFNSKQWVQPDGRVKLPIPFNVLTKANYLVVEFPNAPVPMGDNNTHINKFFYFIDNVSSKAPNCCECIISLDYWQTFITSTNISYMMLEQGHAPLAAAPSPKDFLANPIDNTKYLLEPDVNGNALSKVKQVADYIFNSGDMYAVLAMSSDGDSKDWGTYNTETMRIPSGVLPLDTGTANYEYIALPSDDLVAFYFDVATELPYFFEAVKCCMYISKTYLNLLSSYKIAGHTVYKIKPKNQISELATLSVSDFGYDDKYANITKLYTSQYAAVELVDQDGNKSEIKIENVGKGGKINLYAALNIMGPSTGFDAHILNIGGSDTNAISFNQVNKNNLTYQTGGDWYEFMYHWDVPQFAIFLDQEQYVAWRNWWGRKQAILAKDTAYTQSIDIANTAKANGDASSKMSYDNTARSALTSFDNANASTTTTHTNAIRSATAGYSTTIASNATSNTNALNSNSTSNTNALADNTTSNTNTLASNATNKTNSDDSADNSYDAAERSAQTSLDNMEDQNEATSISCGKQNNAAYEDTAADILMTELAFQQEIESTIATNVTAGVNSIGAGIAGGAVVGSAPGAVIGAAGGVMNAVSNITNSAITLSKNRTLTDGNQAYMRGKARRHFGDAGYISGSEDGLVRELTNLNINTTRTVTTRSANTSKTIAGNNRATTKANNARTKTTADANANRTKTTADANANRTKSTADANANRTKTTADSNALTSFNASKDNADLSQTTSFNNTNATKATADANNVRTFDTTNANNQRNLDLAIRNADRTRSVAENAIIADWQNAELNAPQFIGTFANDKHVISKPMSLFVNVKTMTDADIAKTGDHMLRWGYTLNQAWEMDKKQVMKYFTYWKVSDIWLTCCRAGVEDAGEKLEDIFRNGTTVWNDPSKIGQVSIYENWRQ